jgi:hypothetical protein
MEQKETSRVTSFDVRRIALENEAFRYIMDAVDRNGDVVLDEGPAFVWVFFAFGMRAVKFAVTTIQRESVLGYPCEDGAWPDEDAEEVEVDMYDLADGGVPFLADIVASHYHELQR